MVKRFFNSVFIIPFSSQRKLSKNIARISGITPSNLSIYVQALTHHSVSNTIHENGSRDSNERLEYLGDAILSGVIAEFLFTKYPYKGEGFLTEMRSRIVSRESMNDLAMKLGLNQLVQFEKRVLGTNNKNTIFGNALEAFIGAIYLDGGFYAARRFILTKLIAHMDIDKIQNTEKNFKGKLIEWGHKNNHLIEFECEERNNGRSHTKIYTVSVRVNNEQIGSAENLSKKKAEQLAAAIAVAELKLNF